MSLEDLIKEETGNSFKEKLVHYSKLTTTSIYRTAVDMFRIPTANRLRREAESQREPKFLEEVIRDSLRGSVQMFMFGSFLLSPYLGLTALATNSISYIHEKKLERSKKEELASENPIEKTNTSFKQSLIGRIARKTAKFACVYTLIGTMALGHFFANSVLKTAPEYNPALLNVEAQKISLKKDDKLCEFYLLGEVHLYNYSSAIYVQELIKQKNISLLLSEGVDVSEYYDAETVEPIEPISIKEMLKEQFSTDSWKNMCEGLLGATYAVILLGSDYKYQSPSEICYEKRIPVIFLEKPVIREREIIRGSEKTDGVDAQEKEIFIDGREGVGNVSYAFLGLSGLFSILYAPQMYFLTSPARHFPLKNLQKIMPVEILFSGIIDERNELMTEEAFEKISRHQGTCLMRVGLAHVDGVIEEFKKYGEVKVEEVNLEMK